MRLRLVLLWTSQRFKAFIPTAPSCFMAQPQQESVCNITLSCLRTSHKDYTKLSLWVIQVNNTKLPKQVLWGNIKCHLGITQVAPKQQARASSKTNPQLSQIPIPKPHKLIHKANWGGSPLALDFHTTMVVPTWVLPCLNQVGLHIIACHSPSFQQHQCPH